MRILIDENLPADLTDELRRRGHDAIDVVEAGMRNEPDERIAELAQREGRILITRDRGLGDLRRYHPTAPAGIVVFRFIAGMPFRLRLTSICDFIDGTSITQLVGVITIVDPGGRVRIRN